MVGYAKKDRGQDNWKMDCQLPWWSSSFQIACLIHIRGTPYIVSERIMEPNNVANAQSEINEKILSILNSRTHDSWAIIACTMISVCSFRPFKQIV